MTLNGGGMPMERYQEVDGWKEALWLIRSGSGTVTPYGVVYDNGMALEPLYNDRAMQGGVSVGRGQGCHPDQTSGTQGLAVVHSGGQERGLLHIGNGP